MSYETVIEQVKMLPEPLLTSLKFTATGSLNFRKR